MALSRYKSSIRDWPSNLAKAGLGLAWVADRTGASKTRNMLDAPTLSVHNYTKCITRCTVHIHEALYWIPKTCVPIFNFWYTCNLKLGQFRNHPLPISQWARIPIVPFQWLRDRIRTIFHNDIFLGHSWCNGCKMFLKSPSSPWPHIYPKGKFLKLTETGLNLVSNQFLLTRETQCCQNYCCNFLHWKNYSRKTVLLKKCIFLSGFTNSVA